ncbi:S-layer homology domain-containing protein [Paenibacillus senegalensis]|uniref:S-layer homology domain-containing protein n=1 Tax=Paenibacillus senegalensis TaxID=1465766 RepID=UPI00069323F9|nr:S-layer homology domain-containing protein [Paenibacillus senegalensis]
MSKKTNIVQGRERNLFKTKAMKKLSGALATLLVISMLTPILAFAASFDWSFSRSGDIRGTVTLDTYNQEEVEVYIFGPNGLITTTKATYDPNRNTENGYGYVIDFSFANTDVPSSVYLGVYDGGEFFKTSTRNRPAAGGGGGGGWGPIGGIGNDIVGSDSRANADRLAALLRDNANATLEFSGDYVLLPASALQEGNTLKLVNEVGSYTLPLKQINYTSLANQLDLELNDLWIRVQIKEVNEQTQSAIEAAAAKLGSKVLATGVDFYVGAENYAADDQVAINNFGNTYASRTINVEGSVNNSKATGVVFSNNKLSFVPSTFAASGDNTVATLKRNTNSIYTVIESDISFNDVNTHWGRQYIDLLANKLIVDGYEDGSFGPERNVTRAEFAALITRSLGLDTSVTSSTYFTDVTSGSWYAGVVNAAAQAGLVDGYEDGTFRPNAQINREELAAMVVRASAYAGNEISVSASEQTNLLARYADSTEIVWGHKEVAAAIKAGIIDGMTDTTVVPRADATRAQSAAMLKRFLDNAKFIN